MKEFIEATMRCATMPEQWDYALDEFNAAFGISASCMFSIHEFEDNRADFTWSKFFRNKHHDGVEAFMQAGADADDRPAYENLFRLQPQQFYEEMVTFGVDTYDDLPPSKVRNLTEGWGFVMRTAAAVNATGPWIDTLLCQHRDQDEWQKLLRNRNAQIALPILANSLSLGRTIRALRSRFNAALAVLDALGLGVFLVDAKHSVIDLNKAAECILDAADGIRLSPKRQLLLSSPEAEQKLRTLVDGANGLLNGEVGQLETVMAVRKQSGRYDYLLSVQPLNDAEAELEVGLRCAFVTIIDPARHGSLSIEGLQALGQLTTSEADVVRLLVKGYRLSEVAERRDVSINTVKTQLKDIVQKLRCSTQSDVIRLAAATRIPMRDHPNG
ncbi:helix-turn-helix transcriptional regulator [Marivita sp. S6314]|uniref:helix-turn-helix transcriptional regulator n=1 Tax=Marivita sp. S6314 TaxID=2926406 RepID=UPI001FF4073E|nr:helix-turn-helix transcriptional regulator [Marivita sp. S6314]MCK0149532.1 helix-turn-helix transcriptional regulator [Marivita sp. S6314]